MKKPLLLFCLILSFGLSSQEIFFSSGKNYTDFDFSTDNATEKTSFASGAGNFYEIGVTSILNYSKTFKISSSLTLDEYNANTGDATTYYSWRADYIGIKNNLDIKILNLSSYVSLYSSFGLSLQMLINGQQQINGLTYDLTKQEEFKGLFISPNIGASLRVTLSKNAGVSAGYSLFETLPMKTSSDQNLSFISRQIQFKFIFSLD